MTDQVKVSYESIGTSSYLTVILTPEAGLVNYQMEMLTSNEISHILPVSKRLLNGEILVYYNITSRVPLSQVLGRRKLKREEFIRVVKAAVSAARDAGEYQLPMEGFVMETDYIYVNPSNCEPYFVYLPVVGNTGKGIKNLILELIMQGKIEMSGDNFVQALLETVNSEPLSLDALEACVDRYAENKTRHLGSQPISTPGPASVSIEKQYAGEISKPNLPPQPAFIPASKAEMPEPDLKPQSPKPAPPAEEESAAAAENRRKPPVRRGEKETRKEPHGPVGKEKAAPEETADAEENVDGFDPEKAKKKFLLPQAVVMVAIAAAVSFGFFTDETGAIVLNNILAVVIVVAVAEIILYREAYVNGRQPKKGKGNKKAAKPSASAKKDVTVPQKVPEQKPVPTGARRAPAPQRETKPVSRNLPEKVLENAQPQPAPASPQPVQMPQPRPIPMPQEQYQQPQANNPYPDNNDTELGAETELYDENAGMSAYLEYYENGTVTRVPLDKPSVLIGRLRGQVDFVISNPRVGKIHAEFIAQNGQFFVKDINSKNGTYINSGERISSNIPYPLHDNDRVRLADSEFTLRCSS